MLIQMQLMWLRKRSIDAGHIIQIINRSALTIVTHLRINIGRALICFGADVIIGRLLMARLF